MAQNQLETITPENVSIEKLLSSNLVKNLGNSLCLTETQVAKANKAVLDMLNDEKLKGTKQMAKVRFAYQVATLNYKNSNAVAPVKYGDDIQAQVQYQAIIEDMIACGGLVDNKVNFCKLYEKIDYKPKRVGDYVILELPKETPVKDMFDTPKVIGYYCYVQTKDYGVISAVMSVAQVEAWATQYSKAYRSGQFSPYKSNFDDMAIKTVIKKVGRAVLKLYPFDRLAETLKLDFAVFDKEGVSYKDNPNNDATPTEGEKLKNKIELPQDVVEVETEPSTTK